MTGKRRFVSYVVAVTAMTAVEIVTAQGSVTPQGMSMNFVSAFVGVAALHFGGVAADKWKNGGK